LEMRRLLHQGTAPSKPTVPPRNAMSIWDIGIIVGCSLLAGFLGGVLAGALNLG
jgi:hypothetical protein